ncbi:MAG: NAD(P)-dependent oxidoreductase [Prevotellaceae bacterium]|jgi:nucleoside-diphosphate-sugar epimerase|nr:NAD(P)-dependent oxidoreductase [Prevotellaceae bacterium]
MEKILITGASGFIGSFLVEYALDKDYETYAGIRASSSKEYLKDERIRFIDLKYADKSALVTQLTEWKQQNGKWDYIIHNAGVTKCKKKDDFDRVNFRYTKNFIEALIEADMVPKKFIYTSSLSAWGPGDNKTKNPIMLCDEPKPDTLYGKSKLKAEEFISSIPTFPYIFMRPTGVYGPREKDYFVFLKTVKGGLEPSMGFGEQLLTFIYCKDLVKAVFLAIQKDVVRKGYFITDGNIYTNKEYGDIVKKHLGKKRALKLKVPLFLVKGISSSLDTVCGWFGSTPTLNCDKYKILRCMNWKCEVEPIQKDLGFIAEYDLDKGIAESIEWYRNEKWL